MNYIPPYIDLHNTGVLEKRAESIGAKMKHCTLCPHRCGADRTSEARGKCRSGMLPVVASYHAHFGEESCLVGRNGSGTIFFANCNLSCIFCQNYDISQLGGGEEISYDNLADMMLALQARGCHNINFVSPTHMVCAIVEALLIAIPKGLSVPLVYNSGGYDSVETLQMLNGIIDIYMPDFKYMDAGTGEKLSGAKDYPGAATAALREMHHQVGDLQLDESGIAHRGLLVRHLVLPDNLASTDRVVAFLAGLSRNTYVNIMDQYHPQYRARECFDIRRRPTLEEFDRAVSWARKAGLTRLDKYR